MYHYFGFLECVRFSMITIPLYFIFSLLVVVGVLGTVVMGQTDDFNCPDLHIGFYPHLYRWDYLISRQEPYSICFLTTLSLTLIVIFCFVQL